MKTGKRSSGFVRSTGGRAAGATRSTSLVPRLPFGPAPAARTRGSPTAPMPGVSPGGAALGGRSDLEERLLVAARPGPAGRATRRSGRAAVPPCRRAAVPES